MTTRNENIAPGFAALDQTNDPSFYVEFLKATDKNPDVATIRGAMRRQMKIGPGHSVVDIGCGIGTEPRALLEIVGESGRSVGTDTSETMINTAKSLTTGRSPEYMVGDALKIDLPTDTFDSARAERVFMYVTDPRQVLSEMIRVTKPGGRVVVYDFEWDSFWVTATDVALARRLHRFMADTVPNGHIGPQLWNLFQEFKLEELELIPALMRFPFDFYHHALNGMVTAAAKAGKATEEETQAYWADLRASASRNLFQSGMQGFIFAGTKPRGWTP